MSGHEQEKCDVASSCKGKRRFGSRADASYAASRNAGIRRSDVAIYRCDNCGGYHWANAAARSRRLRNSQHK